MIPLAAGETPLAALMTGAGRPCGSHGSTAKLAHNGVALLLRGARPRGASGGRWPAPPRRR